MPVPVLPVPLGVTGDTLWELAPAHGRVLVRAPQASAQSMPVAHATARVRPAAQTMTATARAMLVRSTTRRATAPTAQTSATAQTKATVRPA